MYNKYQSKHKMRSVNEEIILLSQFSTAYIWNNKRTRWVGRYAVLACMRLGRGKSLLELRVSTFLPD